MMFDEYRATETDTWRSIILIGRNVASYKLALAKALISLTEKADSFVPLSELAVPYARELCEHLKHIDTQSTSKSSRYLDHLRRFNAGEVDWESTIAATERHGFANVIEAFHVIRSGETPIRFFIDERRYNKTPGIRMTDDLFRLRDTFHFESLPSEIESRWRLVETSWHLKMPARALAVECDQGEAELYTRDMGRRISLTACRPALNGYQRGACFYCRGNIRINHRSSDLADIDHFFPHVLKAGPLGHRVDQIWNLVLCCRGCNRGASGKFDLAPSMSLLERLHLRNEYLITSHHPLRETLVAQTGANAVTRAIFLQGVYNLAKQTLIATWNPPTA